MKKLLSVFALGAALLISGVAQAQAPGMNPGMAPGTAITTETTTTESAPMYEGGPSGTLPTTGGAPIAMALCGALTAAGGFFVRRKIA